MSGQLISHYRILEKLGEGGMGVVYLAEDTRLARKVAMKFLPQEAAHDAARRQRFELEARAAAKLSHPGIATVHELAETEGQAFIVFEYVPGTTLRKLVAPGGLQREDLLEVVGEIAAALAAAHSAGVVHRDLKPENVIRTPAGHCKILDFGLARMSAPITPDSAAETRGPLTAAGMVLGTVGYMAPEQLEGKEVDFRSDIFSFGTLVYELATGVHPFQLGSPASTIAAIMTAEPLPLTERNRLQPAELDRIVRKCLRKRREERYQSTLDLSVDLANLKRDSAQRPYGTVALSPALPVKEDDSLLRKLSSRVGASPKRWWELHQLFVLLVYSPFVYFGGLKASATVSGQLNTALAANWHGMGALMRSLASPADLHAIWMNLGLPFFVALVLLLITTVVIRVYIVCLAAVIPERLVAEIRRLQTILIAAYIVLACQLAFLGWLVLTVSAGLVQGVELIAVGVATLLASVYVEPVMVRAAFPQAFSGYHQRRTLAYRIAGAHVPYILLLIAPLASGRLPLERVMAGINFHPTALQLGLFAYSLVMMVGSIALLVNGVMIVKEGETGLSALRRWFPAFLGIDTVAVGAWVWMALDGHTPAVIAVTMTLVLLALPFAQLRMLGQALPDRGQER